MTALLVIIYLSFAGLGLPNSVLGSIWPQMQLDLGAKVSLVGYLSMTVTAGTVVSSVLADRIVRRFGVARVTVVSALMTGCALLGFALSPSVPGLFLCALPMGLAAGVTDVALNNFVALHYEAKHMSWLHCFWGIGASVGPVIVAASLRAGGLLADGLRAHFRRGGRPVRPSGLHNLSVEQGIRQCGQPSRLCARRARGKHFPPKRRAAAAVRLCALQCDGSDRRAVGRHLCA